MVKKFALLSFGVLCLSIAALIFSNMATRDVQAQSGQTIIAYTVDVGRHYVIAANGDVYTSQPGEPYSVNCYELGTPTFNCPAEYIGNFWMGTPPVPTSPETWGKIKSQYQKDK